MTGIVERFREWLPISVTTPVVSLGEGGTPLLPAPTLSAGSGWQVYLKIEGLNPTGSFKDRGMALAISKAVEKRHRGVICASTGNTAASAAAYAARARLRCVVVLPVGQVAAGKLAQTGICGAQIVPVRGNFDDAWELVRHGVEARSLTWVNSRNVHRIEGQKTVAFEVVDALGTAPHAHCLPVGNAGNMVATWRGYHELRARDRIARSPRIWGFEAAGAAPIVRGKPVRDPQTIATAIRIGNPASWNEAEAVARDSGGAIEAVGDDEILEAYERLARDEGVFCEPASAASVAGLLRWARRAPDALPPGATVVCTLTGHGLKDPERAAAGFALPPAIPAEPQALLERIPS